MMRHVDTITKGLIGTITPILAALASWQEHLEWGLRILSLVIGVLVGLYSLGSIAWKHWKSR